MTPKAAPVTVRAQLAIYRAAIARLETALCAHDRAAACYDRARDRMEDARRCVLLGGVKTPGDNKETAITRAEAEESSGLRAARDTRRQAETELETARMLERAEREVLKVLTHDPTE